MMKSINKYFSLFISTLVALSLYSQEIPERPNPPKLVNDFAGVLAPDEIGSLESKLVEFNDSTSTQIAVVIVKDLGNYDANQFAYEIGQKWGVGQKGKNNGLVILVKPKTIDFRGYAAISVAYGLEELVPDALGKRIVENEMIPRFKENDYFGGISAAVNVLIDLTKGKYTADQYSKKSANKKGITFGFIVFSFFLIILISALAGNKNNSQRHTLGRKGSDIPFWMLLGGIMGSSRSSGGSSWGNFSSGSGGFGGFGGGSFGGGGASGSW